MEPLKIESVSGDMLRALIPDLSALFIRLVADGASMGFRAPLTPEKAQAFWEKIASDMDSGGRITLIGTVDGKLAGTVQLGIAMPENGLCRADLQKLMVHPDYRRRGYGTALVHAAEAEAKRHNRQLIVLDTEKDSPAETMYTMLGYQRVGEIPNFVFATYGDSLVSTVYFYRILSQ